MLAEMSSFDWVAIIIGSVVFLPVLIVMIIGIKDDGWARKKDVVNGVLMDTGDAARKLYLREKGWTISE